MKWFDFWLLLLLLLCIHTSRAAEDAPVIAVAANFAPALDEIVKQFTAHTGKEIRISAGATGTLVRQIEQGAPFELFLSADSEHVEYLQHRGYTRDDGRIYAVGVLVLYLPQGTRLKLMPDSAEIIKQLFVRQDTRIALANPELAPYGLAGQQVLQRFGQWHRLQDRVVLGENVGQAAQFAMSGSVDAALLPLAFTLNPDMQKSGQFQNIPPDWYAPIRQHMVLLKNAGRTATELYEFISGEAARQIIRKYGYALP